MQCLIDIQQTKAAFATDCSDLMKMVSTPTDGAAAVHIEELLKVNEKFPYFSLSHIPRTLNSKAERLADGARIGISDMFYVNSSPPTWVIESWQFSLIILLTKKKKWQYLNGAVVASRSSNTSRLEFGAVPVTLQQWLPLAKSSLF